MKLLHQILKDIAQYTGSHYTARVFDIFKAIFIRRILGPFNMGLFSALALVHQYGKLHHLGILNALDREIPLSRGQKDAKRVQLVESVGLTCCLSTALVAAVLIALGNFLPIAMGDGFKEGLTFVAILIFADSFVTYYDVLLRTHNEFNLLSQVTIYMGIVETILAVSFVFLWGVYGVFLAMILASLFGILFVGCKKPQFLKIPLAIDWKCLKSLLHIGVPLSFYGVIRTITETIDRILILAFLGRIQLGFYSIALMVYSFVTPLPKMVYTVLCPRFMEAFGKTGDLNKVEAYLIQPTLAFGYLYPVAAGLCVLVLPMFLHYVLPQFLPGLLPAQVLLWGTCFYTLIFMWGYALLALKKQWLMVGFNIFSIVTQLTLCYWLTGVLGWGLNGISLGTAFSQFVLSSSLISAIIWGYQKRKWECLKFLSGLYIPLAGTITSVWLISKMIPYSFTSVWLDLGVFLLQAFVLLVFWGSWMFYRLNQQVPILRIIREWKASGLAAREV